jgi:hypothetical protein
MIQQSEVRYLTIGMEMSTEAQSPQGGTFLRETKTSKVRIQGDGMAKLSRRPGLIRRKKQRRRRINSHGSGISRHHSHGSTDTRKHILDTNGPIPHKRKTTQESKQIQIREHAIRPNRSLHKIPKTSLSKFKSTAGQPGLQGNRIPIRIGGPDNESRRLRRYLGQGRQDTLMNGGETPKCSLIMLEGQTILIAKKDRIRQHGTSSPNQFGNTG